jgi:hypothetical protein
MAKQTFTTGQVLTAAQMTSLQQTAMGGGSPSTKTASYVLTAADAGTVIQMNSASATTITVNTSLFAAGDSVQIQNIGAGVCTITAGTATVNSAGTLGVTQYDGGFLYFSSASSAIWFDYTQAGTTLPLTTKGDLFGFNTTNARVPIGTNGQVLTADSTEALGLKWATSASGGMTLLSTTTLSGATTTISSISQSYNQLFGIITGVTNATANGRFRMAPNGLTDVCSAVNITNAGIVQPYNADYVNFTSTAGSTQNPTRTATLNAYSFLISNYTSTTGNKLVNYLSLYESGYSGAYQIQGGGGLNRPNDAITSLEFSNSGGNLSTGTVLLYGVK